LGHVKLQTTVDLVLGTAGTEPLDSSDLKTEERERGTEWTELEWRGEEEPLLVAPSLMEEGSETWSWPEK
jgi:hypothetical protein